MTRLESATLAELEARTRLHKMQAAESEQRLASMQIFASLITPELLATWSALLSGALPGGTPDAATGKA